MVRGETNVPILFSWSQVEVRWIGARSSADQRRASPPVGGPKGGNENNIRRLMGIRME
jgi:hypothetical protein